MTFGLDPVGEVLRGGVTCEPPLNLHRILLDTRLVLSRHVDTEIHCAQPRTHCLLASTRFTEGECIVVLKQMKASALTSQCTMIQSLSHIF